MLKELKLAMNSDSPIQNLKTLWSFNRKIRDITNQTNELIKKIDLLKGIKYNEGYNDGYEAGKGLHDGNCYTLSRTKNDR